MSILTVDFEFSSPDMFAPCITDDEKCENVDDDLIQNVFHKAQAKCLKSICIYKVPIKN